MAAFSTALATSNRCPDGSVCGSAPISASASAPSGTFTANSHGQCATERMPDATLGPIVSDAATISELIPMPRPSCARGKMKRTRAVLTLMMPAPPSPCTARASASAGSDGASAHPNDATVNTASPQA